MGRVLSLADARELDAREVWLTPGAVAEQGLHAARLRAGIKPRRIADFGAGPGVLGQRAARVFEGAERLGVEVRASERPHLKRNYDEVLLADMFDNRTRLALARYRPDLVVSNPPYTRALEALTLALAVVRFGGWVLFLVRGTWGSARKVWRFLTDHPPLFEFSIAGRPNMRHGVSAANNKFAGDMVGHTWLLFRRGRPSTRPAWPRELLPPLETVDLAWRVRPGTEQRLPSFPDLYLPIAA